MNAAEVIEDARRWADLHRANVYQREGVRRVDALLALAEEQAATIARVRELTGGPVGEGVRPYAVDLGDQVVFAVGLDDLRAALDGDQP